MEARPEGCLFLSLLKQPCQLDLAAYNVQLLSTIPLIGFRICQQKRNWMSEFGWKKAYLPQKKSTKCPIWDSREINKEMSVDWLRNCHILAVFFLHSFCVETYKKHARTAKHTNKFDQNFRIPILLRLNSSLMHKIT